MSKFHISKSGKPAACSASLRACPVGGDHFDSKEDAQAAYESSMAESTVAAPFSKGDVVSLTDRRDAKTLDAADTLARARELYDVDGASKLVSPNSMTKADAKIYADLLEGKKVSDEKLDPWIEDNHGIGVDDGYGSPERAGAGRVVLAFAKAVRAQSPAPSTLPTLDSFDPSTQTLFSNAKARENASIMGKAIRREHAHTEWMNELAQQSRDSAESYKAEGDGVSAQQAMNAHAARTYDALKSEARVQAQLRELQYRFDHDESFKATANADVRRMLAQGSFRGASSTYAGIPIGNVRKVK